MIIKKRPNGKVSAFQRVPSDSNSGFYCEADSVAEVMSRVAELVSKYCMLTGEHPAHIIERMEVQ